jgi:hypothetical protein
MHNLMADIENGDMPLDQRLTDMGLDPKEYKAYGKHHSEDFSLDVY